MVKRGTAGNGSVGQQRNASKYHAMYRTANHHAQACAILSDATRAVVQLDSPLSVWVAVALDELRCSEARPAEVRVRFRLALDVEREDPQGRDISPVQAGLAAIERIISAGGAL